ncbi:hypothetical protein VNO78_08606 [Psophocarpus tetragonolobus]|uniref:2-oxoglutarate-dependent dioxygenase DAO n=1 Tax=Psophocarpus tetragonolobus TaxID=3891 RepID=A0AAN9SV46_PSOTE
MEESIPVIDVGKMNGEEEELKKLREACERWGCFRIINHTIPATLMAEMKSVVEALHDLPVEIKERNTHVLAGSGYVGPTEFSPFFESLGIYDMCSSQAMDNFCSQLQASPHQRQIMEAYGKAVHDLAMMMGKKICESLGIVVADFEEYWICELRLNKNDFTPESVGSTGVGIHTDSAFVTILKDDDNVGGLEVINPSGSFVPTPHFPGTFLVILGDIARVWSNGRFRNLTHRVLCKEGNKRFSFVTFLLPQRNSKVEPPSELVDHDHPRLYPPFLFDDYRKLRFSNNLFNAHALELLRFANS